LSIPTGGTRLPLHVTISALFIFLILLFGVLLSWQSYKKASEIIFSSAEQVYQQIGKEVHLDFKATYGPVVNTLKLLALSPIVHADTPEKRLSSVQQFATALQDTTSVSGIQVGYENGDYFIVRPLPTDSVREIFKAPKHAAFVVDNVTSTDERLLKRLFLDNQLNVVSREAPVATDYDPRQRPWYRQAQTRPRAVEPYLFYFIGKVGTTVTLKSSVPGVVVAIDVSLEQLSRTIGRYQITPGSEVVLVEASGRALAYQDSSKLVRRDEGKDFRIAHLSELGSPVLEHLASRLDFQPRKLDFTYGNAHWTGSIDKIARASGLNLHILMVSPVNELLADAVAIRWSLLITTVVIILFTIPVVWVAANQMAGPMRRLAAEADAIGHFDFDSPLETRSFITEVDSLAEAMRMMKQTINNFLTLINSLAGEKEFDPLLERITRETMSVGKADAAATYLIDDDEKYLRAGALQAATGDKPATEALPKLDIDSRHALVEALTKLQPVILQLDSSSESELQALLALVDSHTATLVAVPLRNRQNEAIGVLCLLYRLDERDEKDGDHSAQIAFMHALSGFAAVSIESRHLLKMQEALLDAFIKLIAGAIDAKSPYTGGHCQRVPALTAMLATAACESEAPAFADYQLDEDQWEALHIASWLHDCGKVTTPEYVVDKATKLETIYDRIHEIRMRFEILKRDAEIRFWEQLAGGGDRKTLKQELDAELARLDDDFAFVAECNEGGEFMAPERIDRLRSIAATNWTRTLDDRIGISWEEKKRKERAVAQPLPATEKLIANKVEHLIEREAGDYMPPDNPWGFRLDVPEYKFNRGELYNLEVARGTLSNEERYKINDHMVQTIIMLEKLPYPKHLRDVPTIAGCHHETMDGKGYPKRLKRDEMSLTARMMAIADIFEALTASDRPYKKAKSLSEAIRILSFMKKDEHIDSDLFELFLTSGIWKSYGEQYLKPEQIDAVDIQQYL